MRHGAGWKAFDFKLRCLVTAALISSMLAGCGSDNDGTSLPPQIQNQAPTISGMPPTTADEDEPFSFTPDAADANGDTLSFSIANSPAWATFNTGTGELSGTPERDDVGTYDGILITVSDGQATDELPPFSIEVIEVTNLIIGGVVTDEPIPDADVVVRIGEDEFTTTANGTGAYEIALKLRASDYDPDALVRIYARGAGAQEQVELITIPGSVAELIEAAGDDEMLAGSDYPRLNVTHVSTARFLLSIDANGGSVPADQTSLETAEVATDVNELIDLAAFIKLIVDDALIAVPEGQTTASIFRDSTGSETVRSTLIRLLNENGLLDAPVVPGEPGEPTAAFREALDNAITATLVDPDVRSAFDAESLAGLSVWTAAALAGRVPYSGDVLEFADDGNGVAFQDFNVRTLDPTNLQDVAKAFTWSLENGVVDIRFTDYAELSYPTLAPPYSNLVEVYGFEQAVVDFLQDANDQGLILSSQVEVEMRRAGQTVTVISAAGERLHVRVVEDREYRIDNLLQSLGWPGELPVARSTNPYNTQVLLNAGVRDSGVAPPTAGDIWSVPLIYSFNDSLLTQPASPDFQHDVFALLAGGSTAPGEFGSAEMQWSATGTALTLQSGVDAWTYTPITSNGDVVLALITYRISGIVQLHTVAQIAQADGSSASNFAADLVQEIPIYWQAGISTWPASDYLPDGRLAPDLVFGYDFMDGTTVRRVLSGFFGFGGSCFNGTAEDCFIPEARIWTWSSDGGNRLSLESVGETSFQQIRTWRVLRYEQGGRAVVVEIGLVKPGPDPWRANISPRLNTLELGDLSTWPEFYDESKFLP